MNRQNRTIIRNGNPLRSKTEYVLILLLSTPGYLLARLLMRIAFQKIYIFQEDTAELLSLLIIGTILFLIYTRWTKDPQAEIKGEKVLFWGVSGILTGIISFFILRFIFGRNIIERSWISALKLCLLGPIVEEIVFRGFVYRASEKLMNRKVAIWVSAVLFAIAHGDISRFIPALGAGFVFGAARYKEESILASIVAHVAANTCVFLILLLH